MSHCAARGNPRPRAWGRAWRRAAWSVGVVIAIAASGARVCADDDGGLPVGTTVDLSVTATGPITDIAIGSGTYVTIEDQGLWQLQADAKTLEKVEAPAEAIPALATDGSTYYLGTGDGLFDGVPGNWQLQVTGLISAICIQNDPPLYLAGGKATLWRSEDGYHWNAVSFPDKRVLRCVIAGNVAYAGTTSGVYRSADGGRTWIERSSGLRALFIEAMAVDGDTVYAATGGSGLYASADQGNSWAQVSGTGGAVDDVSVSAGMIAFLRDGILQQSTDAGQSWTTQDTGGAILLKAAELLNNVRGQQ